MATFGTHTCCLSIAASAVATILVILGSSSQIQGNPLVYPNRFSFQKTSNSSTTQVPLHDHDRLNKSISSLGNAGAAGSGLPTSYGQGFRYDIAGWAFGAFLLACLLLVMLYRRTKRRNDLSSACYAFPVNSNLKADLDSASIITNSNS